jgi:hypothetical protein
MKRFRSAAVAAVALLVTSTILYATGSYSTLPIVEGSSYCASMVSGTGNLSGVTGQGQGTLGSVCAQTVPAGPTAVTGNEVIPADLYRPDISPPAVGLGPQPATALLSMASLNALPITVSSVPTATLSTLSATNTTGGYIFHNASGAITAVTVNLPPLPIDGQQFAISADQVITTLVVTPTTAGQTVTKAPTVLTPSTTGTYGYRFMYNAAGTNWYRLN